MLHNFDNQNIKTMTLLLNLTTATKFNKKKSQLFSIMTKIIIRSILLTINRMMITLPPQQKVVLYHMVTKLLGSVTQLDPATDEYRSDTVFMLLIYFKLYAKRFIWINTKQ